MNTHNRKALAAKVWEVVDSRTATICATDLTQVQASKIAKQMDIGDDGRFQARRMDQSPEAVLGRQHRKALNADQARSRIPYPGYSFPREFGDA